MSANQPRETAQIFQFPAGGRAGLKRDLPKVVNAPRLADVAFGNWYHEEAIREEKPSRSN